MVRDNSYPSMCGLLGIMLCFGWPGAFSQPIERLVIGQDRTYGFGFVPSPAPLSCELEESWTRAYLDYRYGRLSQAYTLLDSVLLALQVCEEEVNVSHRARVILAKARLQERQLRYADAMKLIIESISVLKGSQYPAVLAETYLIKSLTHEASAQGTEAKVALAKARELIWDYEIDQAVSTYYVRASSVERFYGSTPLARSYADSALHYAQLHQRLEDEADALYLQVAVQDKQEINPSIAKLYRVREIYNTIGSTDGEAWIMLNIGRIFYENGKFEAALAAYDTAMQRALQAQAEGFDIPVLVPSVYQRKANAYRSLGQLDTAFTLLQRSKDLELEYAYDNRTSEVLRLEQAFERKQALEKLNAQKLILQAEQRRKRQLTLAVSGLALSAIALGIIIALLIRARKEILAQVKRQELLHDELQHRVKNNFQILISFLEIQAEQAMSTDVSAAFDEMAQRIHNLAAIHAQLYNLNEDAHVALLPYLKFIGDKCITMAPDSEKTICSISGDDVTLPPKQLSALGIIINELMTNSLKHNAAAIRSNFRIDISVESTSHADHLLIQYEDSGTGAAIQPVPPEKRLKESKLGMYLINMMVNQLAGTLSYPPDKTTGFAIAISIPINPTVTSFENSSR